MGQPGPDGGAAGLVDPRLEDQEEGGLVGPVKEPGLRLVDLRDGLG